MYLLPFLFYLFIFASLSTIAHAFPFYSELTYATVYKTRTCEFSLWKIASIKQTPFIRSRIDFDLWSVDMAPIKFNFYIFYDNLRLCAINVHSKAMKSPLETLPTCHAHHTPHIVDSFFYDSNFSHLGLDLTRAHMSLLVENTRNKIEYV